MKVTESLASKQHKIYEKLEAARDLASSAGNSYGVFPGQNKRADMLSDGK